MVNIKIIESMDIVIKMMYRYLVIGNLNSFKICGDMIAVVRIKIESWIFEIVEG